MIERLIEKHVVVRDLLIVSEDTKCIGNCRLWDLKGIFIADGTRCRYDMRTVSFSIYLTQLLPFSYTHAQSLTLASRPCWKNMPLGKAEGPCFYVRRTSSYKYVGLNLRPSVRQP